MIGKLEAIREELSSLINDGEISPEDVVAAARNPNSAMHTQFDWNDTEAAHKHRIAQARALIKRVRVQVIRADDSVVRIPAFVRSPSGRNYAEMQTVAVNFHDRISIAIITLTQCATMLRNLGTPEVDSVVEYIESVKAHLQAESEIEEAV